jgi:hypothetical protein
MRKMLIPFKSSTESEKVVTRRKNVGDDDVILPLELSSSAVHVIRYRLLELDGRQD